MRGSGAWMFILLLVPLPYFGCAESVHQIQRDPARAGIPPQLEEAIDRSVSFADLKADPSTLMGRVVEVGGIVLLAKRAKDRTEIEVLQLPPDRVASYGEDRTGSEGRFMAVQKTFLDPATVEPGSRIMVIGEVAGEVTKPLDEIDYTYPLIEIQHLVNFGSSSTVYSRYGSYYNPGYYGAYGWGPYWGAPYYWGGPYGYRGFYPYYPRRRFIPRGVPRHSAPSRPAPHNIPPQFKRK